MINPKDYQLLFQIETNFLVADLFAQYYKNLECLLILKDGFWKSFIPLSVVEQTLNDGLEIYSNLDQFQKFKADFENYKKTSVLKFKEILKQELTSQNIKEYLLTISEVWKYYSKTEFFYTDKAASVLIATGDSVLKNNLKELEQIKNDGRLFMNSLIFTDDCYLNKLLSLICQNIQVPMSDLRWYGIEEISKLVALNSETISARKKFFAVLGKGEEIKYIYNESEEFNRFFVIEDKKEICGVIANKGIIRGKVKVIPPNYYGDFSILESLLNEMEKGDILVAETTSPELMPACSKAGAIITNQGGLLSHAAIVSREMNIPCIIGTGNATEILKDGMEVEVDANIGIVKIINK